MEKVGKIEDEIRIEQADKLIEFLERMDAYDFFKDLKGDVEKVKEIPFAQFEDFITRINGIARDIPIHGREIDGGGVELQGFVDNASVPQPQDKVPLLKEAYEAVGQIQHKEDVAYLLPLIINAVHLFSDGNGRTSRIMHLLLKNHASKEEFDEEIKKAVSPDGRYNSYDISPGLIITDVDKIVLSNHGISFGEENGGWDPIAPHDVTHYWAGFERSQTPEGKKFTEVTQHDFQLSFIAAYNYLKEKKLLEKVIVNHPNDEGDRYFLSPKKMDEVLKTEDWEKLTEVFYKLKREEVEIMIKAFIEPDKYKSLDGKSNLRDYFLSRVQEVYKSNI